jgi:PucR C-terminal helix-turn-helix domain/GGDEF-like domain
VALKAQIPPRTIEGGRAELSERLEARREEIEAAVMTRVYAVSDPSDLDPAYADGLRAAVTAAVDYGLAAIELGEEHPPPLPPILLAQARLAARAGVPLDTVLRRYFAGQALLNDYVVVEAERNGTEGILQGLLRTQAILFDRVITAVSEEYAREPSAHPVTSEQRLGERLERVIGGELVDTSTIDYPLEDHHLGAIAMGGGAVQAFRDLATTLDRRLLLIRRDDETVWGWLGGRRPFVLEELTRISSQAWPSSFPIAFGEPGEGLAGFRLTHCQARAALPIALCGPKPVLRYAEVALLAAIAHDDLLATSLREIFLTPLERDHDGGEVAFTTLRAYFAAAHNVSSAAVALGVSRRTVANRLRAVEEKLGRPLDAIAAEMEIAVRLGELGDMTHATPIA